MHASVGFAALQEDAPAQFAVAVMLRAAGLAAALPKSGPALGSRCCCAFPCSCRLAVTGARDAQYRVSLISNIIYHEGLPRRGACAVIFNNVQCFKAKELSCDFKPR